MTIDTGSMKLRYRVGSGAFTPDNLTVQLRAGRQSVDVGCMQVNLMHHPDAFASLRQAFDPATNVAYGARFLTALHDETGSWDRAVERYHSAEPGVGEAYRERVYANWQAAPAGASGLTYARVLTPTLPGPRPAPPPAR